MIVYLVFDNPDYYHAPIYSELNITDFAAKHTNYETQVRQQAELDEFAKDMYLLFNPSPIFSEWYEKQKSIGRIYIDTRIRKGLCVLNPQTA